MAISFVGSGIGRHNSLTPSAYLFSSLLDAAGATPTLQQDDIVFFAVNVSTANVTRTTADLTPSGYTAVGTVNQQSDTYDTNFLVSYKVMGATPDTSVTPPIGTSTAQGVTYVVYVFRGVDTTTPIDVTAQITGGINTGVANPPAITPSTAGAWIAAFGCSALSGTTLFTQPANMSATTNHFRTYNISATTQDSTIGGALYTSWASGAFDPDSFGGSTATANSWSAATIALRPAASGPVTHTTTGALTGQIGSVAGSAAHVAIHGTTGALTGQIGSVAGSATRFRAFATSGVLEGQGAAVAGSAARAGGAVTHDTSGAITGQIGSVSGTAARTREHATSGVLTGQIGSVAGTSVHNVPHATSGALTGQGSAVAGSSARFRAIASSGALTGQGAVVSGSAAHVAVHDTSGALAGQGSAVDGASARLGAATVHETTGDLAGQGSEVSGAASLDAASTALHGRSVKRRGRLVKFADELPPKVVEAVEAVEAKPVPVELPQLSAYVAERSVQVERLLALQVEAARETVRSKRHAEALAQVQAAYESALADLETARAKEQAIIRRMRQDDELMLLLAA
jgi:hypothetical protein